MASFEDEWRKRQKEAKEMERKSRQEAAKMQSSFKGTGLHDKELEVKKQKEQERLKKQEAQKLMQSYQDTKSVDELQQAQLQKQKEREAKLNHEKSMQTYSAKGMEEGHELKLKKQREQERQAQRESQEHMRSVQLNEVKYQKTSIRSPDSMGMGSPDGAPPVERMAHDDDDLQFASVKDMSGLFHHDTVPSPPRSPTASRGSSPTKTMGDSPEQPPLNDDSNNADDAAKEEDENPELTTSVTDLAANLEGSFTKMDDAPAQAIPEEPSKEFDLLEAEEKQVESAAENGHTDEEKEVPESAEPPAEPETPAEPEPETPAEPEPETASEPEPEPDTPAEAEPEPKSPTEPEPEPEKSAEPEPEPEKSAEPEPEPEKPAESEPPAAESESTTPAATEKEETVNDENAPVPPVVRHEVERKPTPQAGSTQQQAQQKLRISADKPLQGHKSKVRLDVLFSFGLLTSSETPYLDNYMNAVEEVVKGTLAQNKQLARHVFYDPGYGPFVQEYKKDATYVDKREHVQRVLVIAAIPIFLTNGISIKEARQGICAGLQVAMQNGEFIAIAKRGGMVPHPSSQAIENDDLAML